MTQSMHDREELITLTSDIVAAHVSNNDVAIDQVSALITRVFDALSGLGAEPVVQQVPLEPAVSIRASIRPDHVACLECGRKMKMLKRHLGAEHGLTSEEYRARWGLPADHALVAPNYAAQRGAIAKQNGLGRIPTGRGNDATGRKAGRASAAKNNSSAGAVKPTQPQTSKRRKLIQKLNKGAD
ncbi:transcriptional regulator [Caenibius tardaugens NBRC 16725]|nr:transcriptional regulator [Caenibius tardaugens NBRC 16725]